MKAYLAAPLFSIAERRLNAELAQAVEHLCQVHLPQRDGPLVEEWITSGNAVREAGRCAFESDISAIRERDVLIAVLDGRALDEGVCVEIGFAKALCKVIVGFKTDSRQALLWGNNPMIDGCIDTWARSIDELVTVLARLMSRSETSVDEERTTPSLP